MRRQITAEACGETHEGFVVADNRGWFIEFRGALTAFRSEHWGHVLDGDNRYYKAERDILAEVVRRAISDEGH